MVSSKMVEGYCADIERALREGLSRRALRLALPLPDICTALENTAMQSTGEQYAAWCVTWLEWRPPPGSKPVDGHRLFSVYSRRKVNAGRPGSSRTDVALSALRRQRTLRTARSLNRGRVWHTTGHIQALEVSLCEALLKAARRWYSEVGSRHQSVQHNLGVLAVKR